MSKKFIFTLIFIILCAIIFSGYWHEEDIDDYLKFLNQFH